MFTKIITWLNSLNKNGETIMITMTALIKSLREMIIPRNQFEFKSNNVLLGEVKTAFGYNDVDAKIFISSICKLLTFYIEAYVKGFLVIDVVTFLRVCVNSGWVKKEDAYVNESLGFYDGVFQKSLAEKFKINAMGIGSYEEFITWSLTQKEFIGTLRIQNKSKTGKHSLIVYKNEGNMFIDDTSSRGIDEPFEKHINIDNFVYFTMLTK